MSDFKLENKDFIYVGDTMLTPDIVRARFEQYRREYFDQDLEAFPIVPESKNAIRPDNQTLQEQDYLDHAPYDFSDPVNEPRFKNEFDFHSALLRALAANTDRLFRIHRVIKQEHYVVHAQYTEMYAQEHRKYGKDMGSNSELRDLFFKTRYPALFDIEHLYLAFLEEIEIETSRLQQFSSTASRALSATENSYRARGLLFDKKVVSY